MSKQENIDIQTEQKEQRVEEFKFEPIKGHPYLHWQGKRPFKSTQYFPAQIKEGYGEPVDSWMNGIYWGDNLQVMSSLLKKYRGKIDLIYIDPPFDSKADYKKTIKLRGIETSNEHSTFEDKQYTDIWTNDEYLQFMYERLILLRELLSNDGFIFLHSDSNKNHYLKIIMDEVFGENNFRNELLVKRIKKNVREREKVKALNEAIDYVLFYSKSTSSLFLPPEKYAPKLERWHSFEAAGVRKGMDYDLFGFTPNPGNHWRWKKEKAEQAILEGKLRSNLNTRKPEYKIEASDYILRDSLWEDITALSFKHNYPTEKKEEFIEIIINMASNVGDIIFDCFMGSGTTQAVSMKLGRKFIGADINLGAIHTTTDRLIKVAKELSGNGQTEIKTYYTGFNVYNVNNYDLFKNPVEAKELLIEALEIQPLERNDLYDGEKDGRMVKIMPINRIATKADLNDLITGFDYKSFERKKNENPNKPVEQLLLVCMGHEPDLAASLQKEVSFPLDIEVVDILRDRAELEFKRDAEANVVIKDGHLEIEAFYPMNLLQKLSIMKEDVKDWKELVDSIMIDWNYDGEVFKPDVVDLPEKNEMVKGTYELPDETGDIRVKITDVLSESFEDDLKHD